MAAKRSYGTGRVYVRKDRHGRETFYGEWRANGRRMHRALGVKQPRGGGEGLNVKQAEGAEVAAVRRRRDSRLERARDEARRALDRLAAERDAEIRRLAAEGLRKGAIAPLVGCSPALAYEVLHADAKARYNERRREHWRHLRVA
jgi:hypothetical protein